jgi:hypothetical protein
VDLLFAFPKVSIWTKSSISHAPSSSMTRNSPFFCHGRDELSFPYDHPQAEHFDAAAGIRLPHCRHVIASPFSPDGAGARSKTLPGIADRRNRRNPSHVTVRHTNNTINGENKGDIHVNVPFVFLDSRDDTSAPGSAACVGLERSAACQPSNHHVNPRAFLIASSNA